MFISALAIILIVLSVLVILRNWRMVAIDTVASIRLGLGRARAQGQMTSRTSFMLLWLMFFGLCFM